jgi:hypothetical protein
MTSKTSKFTSGLSMKGPAVKFLLRFLVIFGLLIAPWPGLNQAYSQYFQSLGQLVFNPTGETKRMVVFSPASGQIPGMDTRLTLENAELADASGRGLVKSTEIDARSIGWVPTALTIALILATPIPWTRRLVALAGGIFLIHLFIFFSLQAWIWNNSPDLSLLTLSKFEQRVVGELNYALMNQLGISFTVPVVIWTLVTFRRQDQDALVT